MPFFPVEIAKVCSMLDRPAIEKTSLLYRKDCEFVGTRLKDPAGTLSRVKMLDVTVVPKSGTTKNTVIEVPAYESAQAEW
jgi:hypothetical protein